MRGALAGMPEDAGAKRSGRWPRASGRAVCLYPIAASRMPNLVQRAF